MSDIEMRARIIVRHSYRDYLHYSTLAHAQSDAYWAQRSSEYRSVARQAAWILCGRFDTPKRQGTEGA